MICARLYLQLRVKARRFVSPAFAGAISRNFKKCGSGFHVYLPFSIAGAPAIEVGDNVHINSEAFISGYGGLRIGDNVHIGPRVTIYTVNHNYEGTALPYDDKVVKRPVVIEDNVWIGACVTIVPGVVIGEGAVIAAGTVVTKDVPRLVIVGGATMRELKTRNQDHYFELRSAGRFGGVNGKLLKRS